MRSLWKKLGVTIAVALGLLLTTSIASPLAAQADGTAVDLAYDHVQAGESVLVYPNSICPNAASGDPLEFIYGTFTDSTSQVFDNLAVGYSRTDGSWSKGMFQVPTGAALGLGSLTVYCSQSPSGGSPTRTFDATPVTIVGQTSGVTVDRLNYLHTAIFSSVTPCDANANVEIEWHNPDRFVGSSDYGTSDFTKIVSDTIQADSNGNWWYTVDLTKVNGFQPGDIGTGINTFRATCNNNGGRYDYGSYDFTVAEPQFVALGDSYSSGVGSFNYDLPNPLRVPPSHDQPTCYRSTDSYPYYVYTTSPQQLDTPVLEACSGAVTDNLFNGTIRESNGLSSNDGQDGFLSSDTQLVTLTIGGNDVGFATVVGDCAEYYQHAGYGCSSDTGITTQLESEMQALAGVVLYTPPGGEPIHAYTDVFSDIMTKAPNAKVYIAGYPHLFGSDVANYTPDPNAPGGYKCEIHSGLVSIATVSYSDAQWLNSQADELDQIIQDAVGQIDSSNLVYVSPSTFNGHGLCDSSGSWINPVTLDSNNNPVVESFHPIIAGMQFGYGEAFENEIG